MNKAIYWAWVAIIFAHEEIDPKAHPVLAEIWADLGRHRTTLELLYRQEIEESDEKPV